MKLENKEQMRLFEASNAVSDAHKLDMNMHKVSYGQSSAKTEPINFADIVMNIASSSNQKSK